MPKTSKPAAAETLRESLLAALAEDFREHGAKAIAQLREERPADYVKAVTAHLPADPGKPDDLFAPYSDAELIAVFERLRPGGRARGKTRG